MSKKFGIRMAADYFAVEAPVIKEKTEAGIIKPDSVIKRETEEGTDEIFLKVVAVGKDVPDLNVGDNVLLVGTGQQLKRNEIMYWLMHKASIYGVEDK